MPQKTGGRKHFIFGLLRYLLSFLLLYRERENPRPYQNFQVNLFLDPSASTSGLLLLRVLSVLPLRNPELLCSHLPSLPSLDPTWPSPPSQSPVIPNYFFLSLFLETPFLLKVILSWEISQQSTFLYPQ